MGFEDLDSIWSGIGDYEFEWFEFLYENLESDFEFELLLCYDKGINILFRWLDLIPPILANIFYELFWIL